MKQLDWTQINWHALAHLRSKYIDSADIITDYWNGDSLLAAYDATFAARIGWKWDAVLREMDSREIGLPEGLTLLDWGCGTGIAGRKVLEHFGSHRFSGVELIDRSSKATAFAARQLKLTAPNIPITQASSRAPRSGRFALVISHVLSELSDQGFRELCELAMDADVIIWVEPGTHRESRKLINAREQLRQAFDVLAPCTHQKACGMMTPESSRHWCHNFAEPPTEIFHSAEWKLFSSKLGIDLRSLPVSFLIMKKRIPSAAASLSSERSRVIGFARRYKGYCKFLACDAINGVMEKRMLQRVDKKLFKELTKHKFTQIVDDTLGEPI